MDYYRLIENSLNSSYPVSEMEGSKTLAIFPVQALLTHSCLPNLQYIEKVNKNLNLFEVFGLLFKHIIQSLFAQEGGRKIVLQSVRNIEKGELLTVR
jgi:hypothetical protein